MSTVKIFKYDAYLVNRVRLLRLRWLSMFLGIVFAASSLNALANADLEGVPPQEICALCHAIDGNSHMAKFPKLAAQPEAYLDKQIRDFMSGARLNDGGQMQAIVTEITASDIPAIVSWFSSQLPPPPADDFSVENTKLGQLVYTENGCGQCHGEAGTVIVVALQSQPMALPHLSSQHSAYLLKQLTDFTKQNREHPQWFVDDTGTKRSVSDLSSTEHQIIADFLASSAR